jgi:hypothetical protein
MVRFPLSRRVDPLAPLLPSDGQSLLGLVINWSPPLFKLLLVLVKSFQMSGCVINNHQEERAQYRKHERSKKQYCCGFERR